MTNGYRIDSYTAFPVIWRRRQPPTNSQYAFKAAVLWHTASGGSADANDQEYTNVSPAAGSHAARRRRDGDLERGIERRDESREQPVRRRLWRCPVDAAGRGGAAAAHPLARGRVALRGAGETDRAGRRCPRRGGVRRLRGSSPRCAACNRGGRRSGDPAAQLRAGWAGALLGPPGRRAARPGRFRPDVPLGTGTAARGVRDRARRIAPRGVARPEVDTS